MKNQIIILTQYYPPEHGAPQNRLHDLARRAVAAGHEVAVMTAMPNYPGGRVLPGYKGKFTCREEIDGVRILRSWIFASKRKSTTTQLCVYFSFVLSSLFVGMFRLPKADFLICESPPLFLGLSALILKSLKRTKLVMNISDLWPESAVQLGVLGPGLKLRVLECLERRLYRKSALVLGQTEGIVEGVKKSCPDADTFLFPNGVDLEMFELKEKDPEIMRELELPNDHFIIGYGGNHGRSQALGQVLETAEMLSDEKVFFALFGDGPEKAELQKQTENMGLENIRFYPSQAREKMAAVQACWDIALVPLRDIPLFDGARPSKMFELMAGEIPFIFCGRGEGAELAEESGCAKITPPEDPAKLAEAIISLQKLSTDERKKMGRAGRIFVSEKFNRAKLAEILLEELAKRK